MQEISLQNRGLRSGSLKLGFGAEIQDLHRTPHTGVGRQKKRRNHGGVNVAGRKLATSSMG